MFHQFLDHLSFVGKHSPMWELFPPAMTDVKKISASMEAIMLYNNYNSWLKIHLLNDYRRIANGINICNSLRVEFPNYFFMFIWSYIEKWIPCWLVSISQIRQRFYKYVVRFCHQNISASIMKCLVVKFFY